MALGCALEDRFQRTGLSIFTIGLLFFMAGVISYGCGAISSTPFPLIDHSLLHFDKLIHFNTLTAITWTHEHQHIHRVLRFAYDMWAFETVGIPILCAVIGDRDLLVRYINAILIANIIGSLIYYFFPSCGPASILHSSYFPHEELIVYPAYVMIHKALPLHDMLVPLIAFPSFHVIHAVIFCCALKKYWPINKPEWRIPLIALFIINCLLIISTFMLGHHYIADVFGGFVVAILAWACVGWLCPTKNTPCLTHHPKT
mgnify:CR=1 FL=1